MSSILSDRELQMCGAEKLGEAGGAAIFKRPPTPGSEWTRLYVRLSGERRIGRKRAWHTGWNGVRLAKNDMPQELAEWVERVAKEQQQ